MTTTTSRGGATPPNAAGSSRARRMVLQAMMALPFLPSLARAADQAQTDPDADRKRLRIGIIGAGNVGSMLATLWVQAGYPVMLSSRKPDELAGLVNGLGPLASAGSLEQAAAFGDVVVLAVPYAALPQIGRDLGGALRGKVVLDATNPITKRDGEMAEKALRDGVGETSASFFPGAAVVRAFTSIAVARLPQLAHKPDPTTAIPVAGDDVKALSVVSRLVRDTGFEPVVVSPLSRARDFAPGTPLFLQALPASELRQRLQVAK